MNTIPLSNETRFNIEGVYLAFNSLDVLADKLLDVYYSAQMSAPGVLLIVEFELPILDTRGKRMLMRFLKALNTINSRSNTGIIMIEWRYQFEDEDMEEFGELIEESTSLEIHMIQTEAYAVLRKL
ncbi:MAG: DUF1987 domain-containing protein [Flavobacteriales bacterium]|nr:DUF1987 domain-containing protein [Flavobacteriales bacterium]